MSDEQHVGYGHTADTPTLLLNVRFRPIPVSFGFDGRPDLDEKVVEQRALRFSLAMVS